MRTVLRFAAFVVLVVSLSGCGIIDLIYLPPSEDTAQELFEAGNDAMRDKDYASAIERYTRLKDAYQFSPYAVEAELSLADALFLDGDWAEAIEAYKEFESLHPRHEAIPYVLYNIGMANYNYYPSIDRPVAPIEEAYAYFKRIYESYPDSEYAEGSFEYMGLCRRLMAEHELYIADFYFRMQKYNSAWLRYRGVVDNYKDITDLYTHAEEKARAAFMYHREAEAREIRDRREGTWKDWFSWL
jgi:outer membrane protein assembly factor BamD